MEKQKKERTAEFDVPLFGALLRWRYWYWFIVAAGVLLALLVGHFSVHVAFWDQWELVKLFQDKATHSLTFHDFWMQHNEHRIFFPRIIMFVLAMLTRWDPYYEVFVNVALGIAIFGVLYKILKKTFYDQQTLCRALAVAFAWMLFSPVQWENWLWGWQIQWFLSVVGVVLAIHLLHAKEALSTKRLAGAIAAGVLATYSLANGGVVWAVGLYMLILYRRKIRDYLAWLTSGIVSLGLYYSGYVNPAYHPSKTLFLEQPYNFVKYVLVYIGRPLTYDIKQSPYIGLLLLMVFVVSAGYLLLKDRPKFVQMTPWIALALYGLAGALLTAVSRLGLGIEQSYSSRYTTISTLFLSATLVLCVMAATSVARQHPNRMPSIRYGITVLFTVLALAVGVNYGKGYIQMRQQHNHLVRGRTCAMTATSPQDACLLLLYPNAEVVWQRLEFLRSHNLGAVKND